MADRFAALGYAVVAPALFDRAERGVELGYTQDDIAKGREYRMKLTDAQVMADVAAAAAHLAGKKLGIVGYCFGGTVAWWGATRTHSFAASSCWYGGGIAGTRDERPNCPVQMHFGEKDTSIPTSDIDAIRAAQPKVETYVYMGAGHGFGCDERGSFSQPDYELAQSRTVEFFATHLA
jgi:carboxymethylenebutenolidase